MKRLRELRELERSIEKRKRFDPVEWCRSFCHPTENNRWFYIVISGGDVLDRLTSATREKRVMVVDIDTVPHTVVKVKAGIVDSLRRAKNLRTFFRCLSTIVSAEDLRRYHGMLWVEANNLEANIRRVNELQKEPSAKKDGVSREVGVIFANNSVRSAARHYGNL